MVSSCWWDDGPCVVGLLEVSSMPWRGARRVVLLMTDWNKKEK